jgi:hypothetical protein
LVIQKSGLPLYAQSFEFADDDACRSFNKIIKTDTSPANAHLMSSYFSSIQLFADEMISDKLNLVDLGFNKFEILGLVKKDVFFIGIFQNFPDTENTEQKEFLKTIADAFLIRYPMEVIQDPFVSHQQFADFTDIINQQSQDLLATQNCRNCLTKCTEENKGCLPHSFYFNKVEFNDDVIQLIDTE